MFLRPFFIANTDHVTIIHVSDLNNHNTSTYQTKLQVPVTVHNNHHGKVIGQPIVFLQ